MCGIVAVFGGKNASELVLEGLCHLEYRGYDSWGVGAYGEKKISIAKEVGKISAAELPSGFPDENLALGHTRWATHGGVTSENAHPHCDEKNTVAVVQNGILENYEELRSQLRQKGYRFASDTDTEILPHLISDFLQKGENFLEACKKTADLCEGRFAFVAFHAGEQRLVAIRQGSPLILGLSDEQYFLASDTPAFLEHTQRIHYIDDGELVEVDKKGARVFSLETGEPIAKREILLEKPVQNAGKGDHEHFMMKEIFEQKETIQKAIDQNEDEILAIAQAIRAARGTFLIGCGTAHKVAMAGEYFFSRVAKRHINTVVASEFPLFHDFLRPESLVIAISQSGETADVIEALEVAKASGARVLSIVNSRGSTIDRLSDFSLHINAGQERAVASTKAATSQLSILMLLAFACVDQLSEGRRHLVELSAQINDLLNPRFTEFVASIAKKIADQQNIFIIGRGTNYPMALEAAIKIQEVSYIHAEGFAGAELKHGPIAMIEEGTPTIVLVGDDPVRQKEIVSNAMEIKARGGHIIGISPISFEVFDDWIRVPSVGVSNSILNLIPVQILSYFLALKKGFDPDQPRNLAKSVTVK